MSCGSAAKLLCDSGTPDWSSSSSPSCSAFDWLPYDNAFGKATSVGPSAWVSVTYKGDLGGVLGSWLLLGSDLAAVVVCGVNQQDERSLYLSLPLFVTLPFK